ncbi:hypothetical protein RhiirA4_474088 [Rhizophagus irregularis]|uniref:Uncharacterized protein n=1 Tax=Rhizophagus irregularis TaxID=588596 RepID=A0A2I1H7W7_9GLOM|nr:hypothetical protein RhiirA4_474088 [Rhizophagus irregularis]
MPEQSENFSSRVFVHNYPTSSRIEAHYQSNGRFTYCSYYNIISPGNYPDNPKLTQKSRKKDTPQYPIPDNYIVEIESSGRNISWKENRTEWGVNSTKSSTVVFLEKINCKHSTKVSGPRLFGSLYITYVYKLLYPQ